MKLNPGLQISSPSAFVEITSRNTRYSNGGNVATFYRDLYAQLFFTDTRKLYLGHRERHTITAIEEIRFDDVFTRSNLSKEKWNTAFQNVENVFTMIRENLKADGDRIRLILYNNELILFKKPQAVSRILSEHERSLFVCKRTP